MLEMNIIWITLCVISMLTLYAVHCNEEPAATRSFAFHALLLSAFLLGATVAFAIAAHQMEEINRQLNQLDALR